MKKKKDKQEYVSKVRRTSEKKDFGISEIRVSWCLFFRVGDGEVGESEEV